MYKVIKQDAMDMAKYLLLMKEPPEHVLRLLLEVICKEEPKNECTCT